jgi:hypothetical protein
MSDDSFVREVDEELRHDRFREMWSRFGNLLIAAALLLVAGTAAWRGYEWWSARQAAASGDRFVEAIELIAAGKQDEGSAILAELEKDGSGKYPVLARFRLAAQTHAVGDTAAAMKSFDAIAADSSAGEPFQSLARLRAGILAVDVETYDQVKARLEALAAAGGVYRHLAREALGLSAYRAGAAEEAAKWFGMIVADNGSGQGVRGRAQIMLDLLAGQGVKASG